MWKGIFWFLFCWQPHWTSPSILKKVEILNVNYVVRIFGSFFFWLPHWTSPWILQKNSKSWMWPVWNEISGHFTLGNHIRLQHKISKKWKTWMWTMWKGVLVPFSFSNDNELPTIKLEKLEILNVTYVERNSKPLLKWNVKFEVEMDWKNPKSWMRPLWKGILVLFPFGNFNTIVDTWRRTCYQWKTVSRTGQNIWKQNWLRDLSGLQQCFE